MMKSLRWRERRNRIAVGVHGRTAGGQARRVINLDVLVVAKEKTAFDDAAVGNRALEFVSVGG